MRSNPNKRLSLALSQARRRHNIRVGHLEKTDPKLFWSTVRSRITRKPMVDCVYGDNGILTFSDSEAAEALNRYFCCVFTQDTDTDISSSTTKTDLKLSDVTFSLENLRRSLKTLSQSSSAGSAGMTYSFFQNGGDYCCINVFDFLPTSFRLAIFPTISESNCFSNLQ